MASSVIIVGAGISGLAAARTLAQAGVRVIVLEAATRLGGRIFTVHQHGHTLELGAEFLHGTPPDLWALVEDAEAETQERTGSFLTRTSDGKLISLDEDEQPGSEGDDALESLKTFPGPDLPFLEYARSLGLSDTALVRELGYVEGFNAADAREVSSLALGRQQQAEDAIEGDRVWRLPAGYNHLPAWLAAQAEADGAHIRLGAAVTAVDWSRGHAKVTTATGETLEATHVLLTLPLGVLQAGDVRITPEPREHLAAAVAMRMGHVFRASLVFSESLWPPNLSFLLSPALEPSVWWTVAPGSAPILTAWTGGPRSAPLLALPPAELEAHLLDTIATALDLSPAAVRRSFVGLSTHNWSADPLFRGAYSWVPVGGLSASETLATPVEDTLFFAGEHTDTSGHWGTVHAALRSGVRAARQVLGAA